MDKDCLINKKICFYVENHNQSEYIQNYLFSLGFVWISIQKNFEKGHGVGTNIKSELINQVKLFKYPIVFFIDYDVSFYFKYYISTSYFNITDEVFNSRIELYDGKIYKIVKCDNFIRKIKLNSLKQ